MEEDTRMLQLKLWNGLLQAMDGRAVGNNPATRQVWLNHIKPL